MLKFVVLAYKTKIPLHICAIGSIICQATFIFLNHNSIDILYKLFTAILQVTIVNKKLPLHQRWVILHQILSRYLLYLVFVIQPVTCRLLLQSIITSFQDIRTPLTVHPARKLVQLSHVCCTSCMSEIKSTLLVICCNFSTLIWSWYFRSIC